MLVHLRGREGLGEVTKLWDNMGQRRTITAKTDRFIFCNLKKKSPSRPHKKVIMSGRNFLKFYTLFKDSFWKKHSRVRRAWRGIKRRYLPTRCQGWTENMELRVGYTTNVVTESDLWMSALLSHSACSFKVFPQHCICQARCNDAVRVIFGKAW